MCAAGAGPRGTEAGLAGEKEKREDASSLHPWSKPSKTLTLRPQLKVSNELLLHNTGSFSKRILSGGAWGQGVCKEPFRNGFSVCCSLGVSWSSILGFEAQPFGV